MSKDLTFALNARAAWIQMQKQLTTEVEGVAPDEVQYLTDVAPILAGTLPADLSRAFPPELIALAEALLSDEAALESLYANMQRIAGSGYTLNMMTRPEG